MLYHVIAVKTIEIPQEAKEEVKKRKAALAERAEKNKEEADIHKSIHAAPGPFRRALLRYEKENHVKHEFYHGGSFNGNTCQLVLKSREALFEAMQPKQMLKRGEQHLANTVTLKMVRCMLTDTLLPCVRRLGWGQSNGCKRRCSDGITF